MDLFVKDVKDWKLSDAQSEVKVKQLSGAKAKDMKIYIIPDIE